MDIIQEVLNFKFDPDQQEKQQEGVISFPSKKITTVDELVTAGDLRIGGVPVGTYDLPDGAGSSRMVGGEECEGCLSIWCGPCKDNQTKALMQVAALLKKLDYAESLFPSTQKLAFHHPEWKQDNFINRYKALCVWYNMTVQLRMKVKVLGKLLGNMTNTLIPWPDLTTSFVDTTTPTSSHDSGTQFPQQFEDSPPEAEAQVPKSSSMSNVRFVIDSDKSDASSNPSDSNNSTDSGHTTASTNSGLLMPPTHSAGPASSGLRRCLSDIFIEANPYRYYWCKCVLVGML